MIDSNSQVTKALMINDPGEDELYSGRYSFHIEFILNGKIKEALMFTHTIPENAIWWWEHATAMNLLYFLESKMNEIRNDENEKT